VFCRLDGTRLQVLASAEDPRIGEVVDGRYTLLERLGQGAMGVVYRAVQRGLEREVAVKILKRVGDEEHPTARRFLREVRAVSQLNHRNIVTVYDVGETDRGEPYLSMELLRGVTLRQQLAAAGPLGTERALTLLGQVCEGLHAAHARGIIHRDLKPTNLIVVGADEVTPEHVKILDFGLAKLDAPEDVVGSAITRTGHICGTPLYMSPEQALGIELDGRSDLYAVGLIAFELLTGATPFRDRAVQDILRERIRAVAPPLAEVNPSVAVHPAIEAAVLRALARDPGDRPATALEFKAELEAAATEARRAAGASTATLGAVSGRFGPPRPARPTGAAADGGVASSVVRAAAAGPPSPSEVELPRIPLPDETEARRAAAASGGVPGRRPSERRRSTAPPSPSSQPAAGPRPTQLTPSSQPAAAGAPGAAAGPSSQPAAAGAPGAAAGRRPTQPPPSSQPPAAGAPGAAAGRRPMQPPPSSQPPSSQPPSARPPSAGAPGAAAGRRPSGPGAVPVAPLAEQVAAARQMLAAAGEGPRRPWCEINLAELRNRQGRRADAEHHAREAIRLLRGGVDPGLQARAADLLADLAEADGNDDRAIDWVELAIEGWRAAGNHGRLAWDLGRLGGLHFRRQHHGPARAALEKAVALDADNGEPERLAANLRGLGAVLLAMGRPDDAARPLWQSLEVERRRGDPSGEAWSLYQLGRVAGARGDWQAALQHHEEALARRIEAGSWREANVSLQHVVTALVQAGRPHEAEERLQRALSGLRERRDDSAVGLTLRRLGDLAVQRGDWNSAAARYEQSEELLRRIGSPLAGGRSQVLAALQPGLAGDALDHAVADVEGKTRR
jgi:tetratricopeptide (TPR) repeat protein